MYKTFIDGREAFKLFSMDPEMMRMWLFTKHHLGKSDMPAPQTGDSEKGFKEFFKELILADSVPPPRTIHFVSKSSHPGEEKQNRSADLAATEKPQ